MSIRFDQLKELRDKTTIKGSYLFLSFSVYMYIFTSLELLDLANICADIKSSFDQEINKVPRLDDKIFRYYYSKIPSENRKVLICSNLKSNLKNIIVSEINNSLLIKIDYEIIKENKISEFKSVEALKIKIPETMLRKFIKFSILSFKKKK